MSPLEKRGGDDGKKEVIHVMFPSTLCGHLARDT
jgi:hypothetical protein